MVLSVRVFVCVSVCTAMDYRYSFDADLTSKYDDEIFDKNSNEDTMEFMDQLKEELDDSITPLSDMTFGSFEEVPFTLFPKCIHELSFKLKFKEFRFGLVVSIAGEIIDMNYIEDNIIEDVIVTPCYLDMGYIDMDKYGVATQPARVLQKRIKWDENMNKFVMHTYYYVTKMETDKEQWRPKLRARFLQVYPQYDTVTEQRLADQKRVIVHNLLLDRKVLVEIRRAVRRQLEAEGVTVMPAAEPREKSFYD